MEIIDFIICDDIRVELGRKHSLMGVYDESLFFQVRDPKEDKWPKQISLAIFVRVKLHENDPAPDLFNLDFMYGGHKIFSAGGNFVLDPSLKGFNLVLQALNLKFPDKGELSFILRLYKQDSIVYEDSPRIKLLVDSMVS